MSVVDKYKSYSGYNMLDSFLHPDRGYRAAEDEYNRSWGEAKGYMQPFQQAGANEIPRLSEATGNLLNPEELENKWASGYEMSPYAKDELARSQTQGLDAASSMGLGASSAGLENIQRTGSSVVNADRRNYLQDLMQKYLAGVQSSSNIFGTGAGVGNSMAQGALQNGQNVAEANYGATNAPGNLFGSLAGAGLSYAATTATGVPVNFGNLGGDSQGVGSNSRGSGQYRPWSAGGSR